MLTPTDLAQIRTVVREEVNTGIDEKVPGMIKDELKPVKSQIAKIQRDLSAAIKFFDNDYLNLKCEVETIRLNCTRNHSF